MKVRPPQTESDWAGYFELRWRVLRAPWNQPAGSERDERDTEPDVDHALLCDVAGAAIAVGRLHFNSADQAQIRYMAVAEHVQGQGFGRRVVEYLEQRARERGVREVVLNARHEAIPFYARLGYQVVGEAPMLFGTIPHAKMRKQLS